MAFKLSDLAMTTNNPLKKGVITGLYKQSVIMDDLPWETIGKLSQRVLRWRSLPTGGFRQINGTYTESTGTFEQLEESLYIFGGYIDVDKQLVENKDQVIDPRAVQTQMKLKALAYDFNDFFINGDSAVTPDSFDGLRVRIASLPASQSLVCGVGSVPAINLAPANIAIPANANVAANALVDTLDMLVYAVEDHKPDALIMNETLIMRIASVLRRGGLLTTDKDQFGRMFWSYNGVKFVDAGYTSAGAITPGAGSMVIGNTEGAGLNSTSIYAVKYGVGDGLAGLQKSDIETKDLGLLQTQPVYRTMIEWPLTIAMFTERAAASVSAIQMS